MCRSCAQAVLNAVMDTQRLEAGESAVHLRPTDVQGVVRDVCHYHRAALHEGVELVVTVASSVPRIQSDGQRIGQVRDCRSC